MIDGFRRGFRHGQTVEDGVPPSRSGAVPPGDLAAVRPHPPGWRFLWLLLRIRIGSPRSAFRRRLTAGHAAPGRPNADLEKRRPHRDRGTKSPNTGVYVPRSAAPRANG